MAYMASHGLKRARPAELVPGTVSVLTARMDYLPQRPPNQVDQAGQLWTDVEWQRLQHPTEAIISVYARGRDYHKCYVRVCKSSVSGLPSISRRWATVSSPTPPLCWRPSWRPAAAGQGWRGKHTLVLSRDAGSMFFR